MALAKYRVKQLSQRKVPRWRQYAQMVVGKPGLLSLLKYELITAVAGSMPGALGLFLRSKLYPLLLGEVGRNVVFGRGLTLRHPHKVRIGRDVVIDDNCVLDAKGEANAGITIGDGAFIGRNTIVYCKDGDIHIGPTANISSNCELYSSHHLEIGSGTLVAAYCYLMSGGSYDVDSATPVALQDGFARGPTVIGEGCWIGAKVVVMDGVRIGDRTVVGAGAVVTRDLPAGSVATGIPARVVKTVAAGAGGGAALHAAPANARETVH